MFLFVVGVVVGGGGGVVDVDAVFVVAVVAAVEQTFCPFV